MFKSGGVIISPVHYGIGEDNWVAILQNVTSLESLETYVASEEIQAAMSGDGVKKDTVHVIALDKSVPFEPSGETAAHVIAITFAQVEESAAWEGKFRAHGELFASSGNVISPVRYGTSADNSVVVYEEVLDFDALVASNQSEETQSAMAEDGVKRDSVKVFKLDKEFSF